LMQSRQRARVSRWHVGMGPVSSSWSRCNGHTETHSPHFVHRLFQDLFRQRKALGHLLSRIKPAMDSGKGQKTRGGPVCLLLAKSLPHSRASSRQTVDGENLSEKTVKRLHMDVQLSDWDFPSTYTQIILHGFASWPKPHKRFWKFLAA
jgi:hypothetical protein